MSVARGFLLRVCEPTDWWTLRHAVRPVAGWWARVYFLDREDRHPPREIGFILGWRGLLN